MKITFLGVAGGIASEFSSNMLIEGDGYDPEFDKCRNFVMLFDCGEDILLSLKAAGRKPEELDAVYISHLHFDHCGGLSRLAYYNKFAFLPKLKLFIHSSMISDLWAMLRPAMEMLHGQTRMMTLTDYFTILPIEEYKRFNLGDMQFEMVAQPHVCTSFKIMYSYGLRGYGRGDWFGYAEPGKEHHHTEGWRFFISSDTYAPIIPATSKNIDENKKEYDYIFMDCDVMNFGQVHPKYDDLKKFDPELKKHMWLYHYSDLSQYNGKYGDMPDAAADGFAGFVKQGQIFEI